MKKILLIVVSLFLMVTFSYAKDVEPQKFDIRVTVKYKDKTLKQIVEIENKISKLFDECYDISIEFEKKQNDNFNLHSYTLTPLDAITTVPGTGFMPNQR
jgi:hypothetical protein